MTTPVGLRVGWEFLDQKRLPSKEGINIFSLCPVLHGRPQRRDSYPFPVDVLGASDGPVASRSKNGSVVKEVDWCCTRLSVTRARQACGASSYNSAATLQHTTINRYTTLEYSMAKTVLITGASGLLGRQVLQAFQRAGWEAVGTGFTRAKPPTILKVDISDGAAIEQALDKVKWVQSNVSFLRTPNERRTSTALAADSLGP